MRVLAVHHEDWKLYLLRAASRRKHRNLGSLDAVLQDAGLVCDYHEDAMAQKLRSKLARYSHVIILGGNVSAYDEARQGFLGDEMRLIEQAISRGLPVLGICLGAQLLAHIHGARVYPGSRGAELGWQFVTLTEAGRDVPLFDAFPADCPVFQWHHDTFDLPAGATHLARSHIYENQAFRIGRQVWAFQFHLEANATLIYSWLRDYAHGTGANAEAQRQATERHVVAIQSAARAFIRGFLGLGDGAVMPVAMQRAGSPDSTGGQDSGE